VDGVERWLLPHQVKSSSPRNDGQLSVPDDLQCLHPDNTQDTQADANEVDADDGQLSVPDDLQCLHPDNSQDTQADVNEFGAGERKLSALTMLVRSVHVLIKSGVCNDCPGKMVPTDRN